MMFLGESPEGARVTIPPSDLLTHGVVLGRTGSGKSGLTIALIEEAAKSGANVLVLDPKGDLANLALSLSTEAEFKPWSDDPAETRLRHGEGLAQSGLSFRDVEAWRGKVDVKVYTPGQPRGGNPVCVFPLFKVPSQIVKSEVSRDVNTVLRALDGNDDPYDPALIFLTEAVLRSWQNGGGLPVSAWPGVLGDPSPALNKIGGMKLDEFFPKAQRTKLARKLIGFQHQADRWLAGEQLDLHSFCGASKAQIAVFSLRHLTEEDRQFFTALLLNKVVEFMFQTDASERLKLLTVLDEARGYLPPHPYNPPTKAPITQILAQGRAQGIGMLIGTQNPMDLDYKALSNVGTWFVGRLRERDCARDLAAELANRGVDPEDVADMPQRSFLLLDKRGDDHQFQTRWCLNYLFGPMSGEQLGRLKPRADWRPNVLAAAAEFTRKRAAPPTAARERPKPPLLPEVVATAKAPPLREVPAKDRLTLAVTALITGCGVFALGALSVLAFLFWLGTRT